MSLIITHATIATQAGTRHNSWLHCIEGHIAAIGSHGVDAVPAGNLLDASGALLLPGFIDLHVHGACGVDVMDATLDGLQRMATFFAQQGVTSFLPTTLTASHEQILAALHTVRDATATTITGAQIRGVHLEGPYLNPAQVGAQNPAYVRPIHKQELQTYVDTGVIKLVSLAPELDDSAWAIAYCKESGIAVSAAHTAADYTTMQQAIDDGITHSTHTYNAMPKLHHREPSGMAALLLDARVRCELIADNIHVHPAMMRLLYTLKGNTGMLLITDAMQATGLPDGAYNLGEQTVTVSNGAARLANGTLAGSVLTMPQALTNLCAAVGKSPTELWRTTSLNAAAAIGIDDHTGSIAIGKAADLVLLAPYAPHTVQATIVSGDIVYQRKRKI